MVFQELIRKKRMAGIRVERGRGLERTGKDFARMELRNTLCMLAAMRKGVLLGLGAFYLTSIAGGEGFYSIWGPGGWAFCIDILRT